MHNNPNLEELTITDLMNGMGKELKKALVQFTHLKKLELTFSYHWYRKDSFDALERELKEGLPQTKVIIHKNIQYPQDGG